MAKLLRTSLLQKSPEQRHLEQQAKLQKQLQQRLQKQLINFLYSADNQQTLAHMLQGLLTPNELESISTRLEITRLLQLGLPQREIAKTLGVGIATVTRGSREVKNGKFSEYFNHQKF